VNKKFAFVKPAEKLIIPEEDYTNMKIINIIQTGRSLEKDENQCLLVYACETLVKVQLNNSK